MALESATPAEKPPQIEVASSTGPLEDTEVDAAVDDIVRAESDAILAAEDAAAFGAPEQTRRTPVRQNKNIFRSIWGKKWVRLSAVVAAVFLLAGSFAWPSSRYFCAEYRRGT